MSKKKKKPITIIIYILLAAIFIFAVLNLIAAFLGRTPAKISEAEVLTQADEDVKKLSSYARGKGAPALQEASEEVNANIIGWILLGDISQPILESADDTYYRTHTVFEQENAAGAVSLDSHCSRHFTDWNNIIYGQNLAGGRMFGALADYDSNKVFEDSSSINGTLWTADGTTYTVTVFAYMKVSDDNDTVYTTAIATQEEKESYLAHVREAADQYNNPDMTDSDSVLTLSTAGEKGSRYVVVAKISKQ